MTSISSATSPPTTELPPSLRAFITSYIARQRRFALVRAIGWAAAFTLLWLCAQCLVDRFFQLDQAVRSAWIASNIMCVVAMLWEPLLRLTSRRTDWLDAAAQIERNSGRLGERLLTLISQSLADPSHRGSPQILNQILQNLGPDLDRDRPHALIPPRRLLPPWNAALAAATVFAAMFTVSWLQMPRLLDRAVRPWLDLPPVATTILRVDPGNTSLVQGSPLTITVTAQHLGDDSPVISISEDRRNWQRQAMNTAAAGQFEFNFPSLDHDISYFCQGGDATSPLYTVHLLHPPTVLRFDIHYDYPAYTALQPRDTSNSDGRIEAPVGSRATINIVSSEPLASAVLFAGADRIATTAADAPAVRSATIDIQKDEPLQLQLFSNRRVPGFGPPTMAIHAIPDLPPAVRFIQPAQNLRLRPTDQLSINCAATDDYAVTGLQTLLIVNQSPSVTIPMTLTGPPRDRRGDCSLDLSLLNLHFGDVLRLKLAAQDAAGHQQIGDEDRVILIAPNPVDVDTHLRLENLRRAAILAGRMADDMSAAAKTLEDSRAQYGGDTRDPQALAAARQDFTTASASASDLNRTLLKTIAHSDTPSTSVALARWVDQTQKLSGAIDRAADWIQTPAQATLPSQLRGVAANAKQLQHDLETAARGEWAQALLSDAQNLAAAPPPIRQRMQHDILAASAKLGLNPADPNLPAQLSDVVSQASDLKNKQSPVDFAKASEPWLKSLKPGHRPETDLDARLSAAARAEALRPDANLVRAGDLELASRAASALTAAPLAPQHDQYPAALAAMQRETQSAASKQSQQIRDEAATARRLMSQWADSAPATATTQAQYKDQHAIDSAMQANADMARHDTASAAKTDSDRAPEQVRRDMDQAQRIDQIKNQQDRLAADAQNPQANKPQDLAQRQQEIAQSIASARNQQQSSASDSAATAMATIDAAQQRLSRLSQQLSAAQQAASDRQLAQRAADAAAKSRAAATQPADQAAAQKKLDQANRQLADASARQSSASQAVKPASAAEVSQWLSAISPQADQAAAAIDKQLVPALSQLQSAMNKSAGSAQPNPASSGAQDQAKGDVNQAASASQSAIGEAQNRLAQSQRELTQRDPLAAAQWFAQSAAGELSSPTSDLHDVAARQHSASAALDQAWQQSTHRAALARLAQSSFLAAILSPESEPLDMPAAHQWSRLRARDGESLNASLRDQNPPGYEQSIGAYFEALNRTAPSAGESLSPHDQ